MQLVYLLANCDISHGCVFIYLKDKSHTKLGLYVNPGFSKCFFGW